MLLPSQKHTQAAGLLHLIRFGWWLFGSLPTIASQSRSPLYFRFLYCIVGGAGVEPAQPKSAFWCLGYSQVGSPLPEPAHQWLRLDLNQHP